MDSAAVKGLFRRHFGFTPAGIVRVPGSVTVLGDYTEEHQGLTVSAAISRFLLVAYSARPDGQVELVSSAFPDAHRFWISRLVHNSSAAWADYIKGILVQLRRRGVHFNGFNAAIHSSIPVGIGFGSSAALAAATALTIRQMFPFSLTEHGAGVPPRRDQRGRLPPMPAAERMVLARTCRDAESEFAGATTGVTAAVSSLLGRAHHLITVDHRFETVGHAPLIGETLVCCDSNVRPRLGNPVAAEIGDHCQLALRALRARTLRSVDLAWLKARRLNLTRREFECAYHVVGEIQRAVFAERSLREDDHRQFGHYLWQSHDSCCDFFRNSCPEVDQLVELARRQPECLGARMIGRGFGGATINLVPFHQAENFTRAIVRLSASQPGREIRPVICQIVDGAG